MTAIAQTNIANVRSPGASFDFIFDLVLDWDFNNDDANDPLHHSGAFYPLRWKFATCPSSLGMPRLCDNQKREVGQVT
ncbi:MAG: hypothetical protein ACRENG_21715 [bacterium]